MERKEKSSVIIQVTFPRAWEAFAAFVLGQDTQKNRVKKVCLLRNVLLL